MPIETTSAVMVQEDRSFLPFPDAQVDGPSRPRRERDGDDLASLTGDRQRPVPPLQPKMLDIGVQSFRDAQPVLCQQTRQPVVAAASQTGLDQEHPKFVAIQTGSVRFIVQLGTP